MPKHVWPEYTTEKFTDKYLAKLNNMQLMMPAAEVSDRMNVILCAMRMRFIELPDDAKTEAEEAFAISEMIMINYQKEMRDWDKPDDMQGFENMFGRFVIYLTQHLITATMHNLEVPNGQSLKH